MKKALFSFVILLIVTVSYAQNLQNANWCFRINAKVNFNLTPPNVSSCANGANSIAYAGSGATVSNSNGQLLFYTNGISVWDKSNNVMQNGSNIGGSVDQHWNQQTTIIVPKPNSPNLYYIFVVNKIVGTGIINGHGGLHYSIVDMCANNGNGEVVIMNGKNSIALNNHEGVPIDYDYNTNSGLQIFENRISSTLNNDKTKVWVSFFTRFNVGGVPQRYAYQYLVSELGINGIQDGVSPNPTTFLLLNNLNFPFVPLNANVPIGALKFSPDGAVVCDANAAAVSLYNFNNEFGTLVFDKNIYLYSGLATAPGYGVEFSPSSQLLYFATWDNKVYQEGFTKPPVITTKKFIRIRQKNLNSNDTAIIVGEFEASPPRDTTDNIQPIFALGSHGDLQLAIDNKIYVCGDYTSVPQNGRLDAITDPDILGTGCNYVVGYLTLAAGTRHEGSLPQMVHKTIFNPIETCPGPWPKLYANHKNVFNLVNDKQGDNCFVNIPISNSSNTINHNGAGFPTLSDRYLIQYNKTTGFTTWVSKDENARFALNSGDVETYNYGYYYKNGSTGTLSTPPVSMPANEVILVEQNGVFITYSVTVGITVLIVRTTSGTSSITLPSSGDTYFSKAIFNPVSKKLFIHYTNKNSGVSSEVLAVLLLNANNTLSLINNPLATIGVFSNLALVNTADQVFILNSSGVLQKYNYVNNNYDPPISILGFFNSNLIYIDNVNQTVEDRILVFNSAQKRLYSINTLTLTQRKIDIINNNNVFLLAQCFFDNSDVFLTGYFNGGSLIIGNQILSSVNNSGNTAFITKFNVQTDFNFTDQSESREITHISTSDIQADFTAKIIPNPVTNDMLNIYITDSFIRTLSLYSINITNQFGKLVLRKNNYLSNTNIAIKNWENGIYYVEIINQRGKRIAKSFIKL